MNLNEFKALLETHAEKPFRLRLPDGAPVPVSFHITEVGRLRKTFLDCGGERHDSEICQLQVWVGEDADHRIQAGKMAAILRKAEDFIPDDSVPLEIEYEEDVISQYTVEGHSLDEGAIILNLEHKHTACLAMELCGAAPAKDAASDDSCCAGSKCC